VAGGDEQGDACQENNGGKGIFHEEEE